MLVSLPRHTPSDRDKKMPSKTTHGISLQPYDRKRGYCGKLNKKDGFNNDSIAKKSI